MKRLSAALATGGALALAASAQAGELRIASKGFTESVILGEVVSHIARSAGATVHHQRGLGGTRLLWNALLAGEIDLYPDYTGTIAEEILSGVPRPDGAATEAWIRTQLAGRGVGVIGPLGFNNSYAVGMRAEEADRLGLKRISDLVRHPELELGFSNEFMSRQDGWPRLRERYALPHASVTGIDHDLAYRALEQGSIQVTDLYATDAEIPYYRLRILEDDRQVFPGYEAVLLYRRAREADLPAVFAALGKLPGRIDADAMRRMNARAKLERVPESIVAAAFVSQSLGIAASGVAPGRASAILRRTGEHLALVGISLFAAILMAIPLGVLAARRPILGRIVLDTVGVVQTIPSLALLVFMIPLLGIGALPATVALFLYSLLPIVRNTHTGLTDIPPALRESAEALGLPPGAILRRLELPMASRAILGGIKSAAVINVGTATIGALIGAGGLGQPILTGIRLDDVGLILEGAVPASVLALAVGWLFDAAERVVVPLGLRLGPRA